MKKITFCIMAICLSLAFLPFQSSAATIKDVKPTSAVATNPSVAARAKTLELRIEQIDKMDKTNMKPAEKQALRKEVRAIKQELKASGGYVYISVGAALLIILLIIILL